MLVIKKKPLGIGVNLGIGKAGIRSKKKRDLGIGIDKSMS